MVVWQKRRENADYESSFVLASRMVGNRSWFLVIVVTLVLSLVPMANSAEPSRPGEYEVKAAFL